MSTEIERHGGCLCGAVRYVVRGEPLRAGLCHCLDCRRTSGSAFSSFAIWPVEAYRCSGEVATYGTRSFCPVCGSRVPYADETEAEIMLGSLDAAPGDIVPDYELWIGRREEWLPALPWAKQFPHDREPASAV